MKTCKRLFIYLIIISMVLALTACAGSQSNVETDKGNSNANTEVLKIGVIQYAPHASLDNCYNGLIEGLKEAGFVEGKNIKIDLQNAMGEQANSDMIAKNMVSSKYDLIVGIATPAAMSAYSASKDSGIPVIFTAVSDPIEAKLVKTLEAPEYTTGTSDVLPLEAQIKMIRAFLPEGKKIGIIYTTGEPNSLSHLESFKSLAPKYGFEIVEIGVTGPSEVASAASTLVAKGVDCINNFTDNNVVNNLSSVIHAADNANIPVFGSEVEQVKNGCLASESIDYISLGKETGKMAAMVLKGEKKVGEIPVALISDSEPVYNEEVLNRLGITLPEEYKNSTSVNE